MRRFFIVSFVFVSCLLNAQKYDNVWPGGSTPSIKPFDKDTFNNHFVMDFSDDTMRVLKRLELSDDLYVESSSLCDSTGKLLMYSNGCNIYGADGQILPNGDSINNIVDAGPSIWLNFCGGGSGYPSGKTMVFIPFFSHHRIFVLHVAAGYKIKNEFKVAEYLLYDQIEEIDDKWVVIKKNQILVDDGGGRFDVTKHANGRDWWIIAQEYLKHDYRIWLLTPFGITLDATLSYSSQIADEDAANPSFSPDGSKFLHYNPRKASWLFDFDRCSGFLSDPKELYLPICWQYSFEATFSPNGRFLYTSNLNQLYQIDLWNPDTLTNRDTIAIWDGLIWPGPLFGPTNYLFMQTGPDGKIYVSPISSSRLFHVIERPNEKGKSCQFRQRVYKTPFYRQANLPNFPYYRLGPIDGSACDTLGINNVPIANFRYYPDTLKPKEVDFIDNSSYEPTDWYWTFGDGSGQSSTEVNPTYTYAQNGVYEVCETVSNQYGSDTYCRLVRIGSVATEEPKQDRGFDVFPNPTSGNITILLKEGIKCKNIKITNISGEILYQTTKFNQQDNKIDLEVSFLSSGLYFIELSDENGLRYVQKFVKE
jgi:hypothetical protein